MSQIYSILGVFGVLYLLTTESEENQSVSQNQNIWVHFKLLKF